MDELQRISDMISQDTDAAARALAVFKKSNSNTNHKQVQAKVDLLTLVIASVRNNFDKQGIDDVKLVSYFKAEKQHDEAVQVLLAKARHFFLNGKVAEGGNVLQEIRDGLLDKISPRVEVVYLTRMAFLHGRRNQYDEQLKISLRALDILNAMGEPDAWHYNISTIFYTNIANCYMANADFDKAWPYLEQSLEITTKPEVSTYNRFNVYSYFAFFYEGKKDYRMSVAWHEKVMDLLEGDASHQTYLVQAYHMATVQCHFLYRDPTVTKEEKQKIVTKQDGFLQKASELINPDLSNGPYLMLLYATATVEYQKQNYKQASLLLQRCLPVYEEMRHEVSVLNCTRLAHEVYYAWGKETSNVERLLKAYELKKKESEIVEAQSMQTHLQKLEAIQVKHELQQAEMNERLLRQQVESMSKQAQLSALNLQEKVALLDELKAYVLQLKRKDYDGPEFARAVSQKIGAVKITEQDKAVLQHKIDDGNQILFKALAEMYPALSPHEVRTCALIKTGMTNKELSKLYGIGERGYEQLRYRIKRKMNLDRNDNLVKHLMELSAKMQ